MVRRSTWGAAQGVWLRPDRARGAGAGVDQSATAVEMARRSGAPVLRRDVRSAAGTGRWQTALLADGNVGLGGDPWRMLRRAGELLHRGGRCVAEFVRPSANPHGLGAPESSRTIGPWFRWATVGVDCVGGWPTTSVWP